MTVLIDTHAFLWYAANDPKLSPAARALISDPGNVVCMSVVSAWELAIKTSLGKITLSQPFTEFLPQQLAANDISLLPIRVPHLQFVSSLPFHHKDPFDRLLIAQSLAEDFPLISADTQFDAYGVKRVW